MFVTKPSALGLLKLAGIVGTFGFFIAFHDHRVVPIVAASCGAAAVWFLIGDRRRSPAEEMERSRPLGRHWIILLQVVFMLAGALWFRTVFQHRLAEVPAGNFEARDDAVITLSHARNLVEYGFVGVSPSGERVEGFSAPLQFWTSAAAFGATRMNPRTFFRWQTELGTLALGAAFAALLLGWPDEGPRTNLWRWIFAFIAMLLCGSIVADSRAFLLWHASGMENVYTHVTAVALVGALDFMLRRGRLVYAAIALVFAASLARIDTIVVVAMLLAAFTLLWWLKHRDGRALRFAVLSLIPWSVFMAWRWHYFGQWAPNTAIAQRISTADRLEYLMRAPVHAISDYYRWTLDVGGSLQMFQLAALPLLLLAAGRSRLSWSRCILLLAVVLSCVAEYALFGPARMDDARTVTQLALACTLAAPLLLLGRETFRARDAVLGFAVLAAAFTIAERRSPDRVEVGWGADLFEGKADAFEKIAADEDLPRPAIATPDLGAVSWRKQFNVVDIGELGSTTIARVNDISWYLTQVAEPDIIQIHDIWSCNNAAIFLNPGFLERYQPLWADRDAWLEQHCLQHPEARSGVWIRREVRKASTSPERRFLNAFRLSLRVADVERELSACRSLSGTRPCSYVGRTLFRFVPELKRNHEYEALGDLLRGDASLRLEYAMFVSSSDPFWWRTVIPPERMRDCGGGAPLPPTLRVVSNDRRTVDVSWTSGDDRASSYTLEAGNSPGSANVLAQDVGRTTTFTATDVGPATYYARVRGTNQCGTSGPSNEIVVVVR